VAIKKHYLFFAATFIFCILPKFVFAQEDVIYPQLPKWEAGLTSGLFYLPDYPGAGESQGRFLILPYVIYRGDFIRADREGGLRARFINSERLDFDVSFGASFPTDSKDNEARAGMPDLDWMGGIGPRLRYILHKGHMVRIDFSLPIRFTFSTDFKGIDSHGSEIHPEIQFRHRALFDSKTFFSAAVGPMWVSESLADYIYQVEPSYVTADRAAYDAKAGYLGLNARVSVVRRLNSDWTTFIGFSKNFYSDSEYRGSPLMKDIETESYFFGLAWKLYTSEEKAGAGDGDSGG
jgi:MipA family protein